MTQKDEDITVDFVKKYWIVGVLLATLLGFGWNAGVRLSGVQDTLENHDTEIKAIIATDNTISATLASMQIQLAQNAQQLQDIKANQGDK